MADGPALPPALLPPTTHRERLNWDIHRLYARQEHDACLGLIEKAFQACGGVCAYPLYIKGLILRHKGQIKESLRLFQAAVCLNPGDVQSLKQVGRSLYLLGKHRAAFQAFEDAQSLAADDWETWHHKGLCHMQLQAHEEALRCFDEANAVQHHEATHLQIAQVHYLRRDYAAALEVYQEALDLAPESPELLMRSGLLHLRLGQHEHAFDVLGRSLTHDPRAPRTILATGSILQDQEDPDMALSKYHQAAATLPNAAELWNNVGLCFFAKRKLVAAISCLKRAAYLSPFEWIVAYNLGIVHLTAGQHASAFHHLSCAINFKPEYASAYMYLAVALARMDDFDNACAAYDRSLALEDAPLTHLNYAITLYHSDEIDNAEQHYRAYIDHVKASPEDQPEPHVQDMAEALGSALGA